MNLGDAHRTAKRHLERGALVYVRQSDAYQVRENTESTALQGTINPGTIHPGHDYPNRYPELPAQS